MEQIHPAPYPDNRLIINEGELNLQRLTAIVVAVEVLRNNLHCNKKTARKIAESNEVARWLKENGCKKVEYLSVSKKIRDLVCVPMELIGFEIDLWVKYHIPHVFVQYDQNLNGLVSKFIRYFVWTAFGTIDYVKTAEKWIVTEKSGISFRLKYRLACLNCLKDTIENLYHEDPTWADEEMRRAVAEMKFPFVQYWKYRMADKVIDLNSMASEAPPYVTIWTYLLEQLDEDDRYSFFTFKMTDFPARVIKELLPKFTEIEQRRWLPNQLCDLMKLFVVEKYPQFAIQLWRYVNDTISAQKYDDIFDELSKTDEYFGDDGTPHWLGDLAMEMWRSASDSLKEKMFQYENGDFFCEWTRWFNHKLHGNNLRDDTFLLEMLSDASPEYRKQFWMAHWSELVIDCESKYFAKFIEACLPEPSDVDKFLEGLANSSKLREHLEKLCQDLKFVELTEFLDQFVRDPDLKADLKKLFVPCEDELSERLQSMGQ